MYAYRSGQRFWEQKGSSWWARIPGLFQDRHTLPCRKTPSGPTSVIETLDIDRVLEEGKPTLSIPSTPEAVDDLVHRKKS